MTRGQAGSASTCLRRAFPRVPTFPAQVIQAMRGAGELEHVWWRGPEEEEDSED